MTTNHQYVSCIKVGGVPIIPPLITPKKREECLKYKIQAIELEKKKERNKLFKRCMEDLARLEDQTKDMLNHEDKQLTCTLENQLTFDNTSSPNHVPYATYKKLQNLKSETIDVSEYCNDGVRVISKSPNTSNNFIEDKTPTPKLIRSNSYTLDSPSPILLAHLEKEARKCVELNESEAESRSLSPITIIDSELEPKQVQLIETDVTVQEVTVTTPLSHIKEAKKDGIEPQLMAVLEQLPPDHASNILKILEKQQEKNLRNKNLAEEMQELVIEEKPLSVSISSSQSLYYSISSPDTPAPTIPEEELRVINLKNIKNNVSDKREWAASKIGAAVRGYLVRRLIRTEKVQTLIETIKDTLLCAIQLHGSEVIEEADVELHRRLIQQVSAACYAFHDVFFTLSVKEQMNIIALDRQRRREKANRPLSSNSSNISIHRRRSSKVIR